MAGPVFPPNGAPTIPDPPNTKKIIIVGEHGVGKTRLVQAFIGRDGPDSTAFYMGRQYLWKAELHGRTIPIRIYDIPATVSYRHMRPQCYTHADTVLLCFAIDDPRSLFQAEHFWYREVSHYFPNLKYILAGLKKDLRSNPPTVERLRELSLAPVSHQQGLDVKEKLNLYDYIELTSVTREGVERLFQRATMAALGLP